MFLTFEGTIILLTGIPVFFAFLLLFKHSISNRQNKSTIFFTAVWFIALIMNTLAAIRYSTQNILILQIRIVLFIPMGISLIIAVDYSEQEKMDFKKMLLICILGTIAILSNMDSNAFQLITMPNGDPSVAHSGLLRYSIVAFSFYVGLIYLIFAIKLYRNSPVKLKKYALINLLGAISFGIISALVTISGLTMIIPGIAEFFVGFGTLLNAIAFSKEPKLAYILPFKVNRLIVINTISGTALFNHYWNKKGKEVEANLITGLFQGISVLANETLEKGNVREIYLEKAILIVQPNKNKTLASILEVSNPSQSLRNAIILFTNEFSSKFQDAIDQNLEISEDPNAQALIEVCFPYIPEY